VPRSIVEQMTSTGLSEITWLTYDRTNEPAEIELKNSSATLMKQGCNT
jgi:hypothetical protein